MRKVLFTFDYPPNDGGISRLCEAISSGFNPTDLVITQKTDQKLDIHSNMKHVFIPKLPRLIHEIYCIYALRKHTKKNDIIITDVWYLDGFLSLFSKAKKRAILTHGAELLPGKGWFRVNIWSKLMKYVLTKSSLVIANSTYTKNLTQKVAPKSNVIAIPLGVDSERFKPIESQNKEEFTTERPLTIGSVSRILKFKGHETVFKAIALIPENLKNSIKYKIAGKGPAVDFLKQRVIELKLESNVEFVGFISEEELPTFYQSLDVFTLMTQEQSEKRTVEGFGLVFLEAQACGIPVIGPKSGGIPDAIEHNNGGWLTQPDDIIELTKLLVELLKSPSLVFEMGKKARKKVTNSCTWDFYTKNLINALDNLQ